MSVTLIKAGKVITKKKAVGTVFSSVKTGEGVITDVQEDTEVVEEFIVSDSEPMANVGVKVGTTKNLGDFNSLRVDVTLYMPSKTDKKSLDKTFKKCFKWCDNKLDKIMADV